MANSKARCAGCREYKIRSELSAVGLSSVCKDSEACRRIILDKHKASMQKRAVSDEKKTHKPRLHQRLRKTVRNRDETCRFCGTEGYRLEIHHISYRSQGGPDVAWNLILLCDEHHRLVHSSKKYWQPVLRAYIWLHYIEGRKGLQISGVERILKKREMLPELLGDPDDGLLID